MSIFESSVLRFHIHFSGLMNSGASRSGLKEEGQKLITMHRYRFEEYQQHTLLYTARIRLGWAILDEVGSGWDEYKLRNASVALAVCGGIVDTLNMSY